MTRSGQDDPPARHLARFDTGHVTIRFHPREGGLFVGSRIEVAGDRVVDRIVRASETPVTLAAQPTP